MNCKRKLYLRVRDIDANVHARVSEKQEQRIIQPVSISRKSFQKLKENSEKYILRVQEYNIIYLYVYYIVGRIVYVEAETNEVQEVLARIKEEEYLPRLNDQVTTRRHVRLTISNCIVMQLTIRGIFAYEDWLPIAARLARLYRLLRVDPTFRIT